jgi:hypothetical protein
MGALQVASLFGVLDLKDNMTPGLDKAHGKLQGLAGFAKGAFKGAMVMGAAGLGILGGGIGLALKEAMDAEVNIAKLEAVIKSTGGVAGVTSKEAQSLADSLSKVTRFSDDTILSAETMLLTFTNIGEGVFPQATEAVLNMGEMFGSTDQAAIMLGKALNDPIAGVTALRRVGVQLSDEQERQIKNFMALGDVESAQGIILEELNKEMGGVAKAAGQTLAGKLAILKNRFLNVMEAVGTKLIPALVDVTTWIADKIVPAIENFGGKISNLIGYIQRFGFGLGALAKLKDIFGTGLGNAIFNTVQIIQTVIGVVKDFARLLITEGLGAITALKEAFSTGGLEAVGTLIFDQLKKGLPAVASWVMEHIVGPLGSAFTNIDWGGVKGKVLDLLAAFAAFEVGFITWAWEHIGSPIVDAVKAIDWSGVKDAGLALLGQFLSSAWDAASWVKEHIVDPIVTNIGPKVDEYAGSLGEIFGKILSFMFETGLDVIGWVKDHIIVPIIDALTGGADSPEASAGGKTAGESLLKKIGDGFLNIASWVLDNMVVPFVNGVLSGFTGQDTTIQEVAIQLLASIKTGLGNLPQWVLDNIITPLATAITGVDLAAIGTSALRIGGQILLAIGNSFLDIGVWLFNNVISPVASAIINPDNLTALLEAAKSLGQSILDGILDILSGLGAAIVKIITDALSSVSVSSVVEQVTGGSVMGRDLQTVPDPRTRDSGGSYRAGQPYMIGTGAQPELWVPGESGTAYPAGSYGGGGGGGINMQGATIILQGVQDPDGLLDKLEVAARRRNRRVTVPA